MAARSTTSGRSPRLIAQYRAFEAILRASSELERDFVELLKVHDLSAAQYNVLRILRGAGEAGLSCGQVGGRLMRHDPDVTRLLDRLEKRQLIARVRDTSDRRIVRTRITSDGLDLLAQLDAPVDAIHERQFGHLSETKLRALKALLDEAVGGGR
jgi:DNA-binding MarR family transcriptional regulator